MTRSDPGPTRPTRTIRARRSRGSPTTGRPRRPPTRPRRPTATTRWAAATGTTRPARRTRRRPASWAPAVTRTTRPGRSIRWTGPARSAPGAATARNRGPATATAPMPAIRSDPGPTRPTRTIRARRSPGLPTTGRPRRPPTRPRRPTATTRWAAATGTTRPARPQHPLDGPSPLGPGSEYREESRPGYRDTGAYGGDPLGSGSYPAHRDPYPPSAPDEPGTYPEDRRGQRYADDPFQSVYPEGPRDPAGPRRLPGRPPRRFAPVRPAAGAPGTTGSPRPFLAHKGRPSRPPGPAAREIWEKIGATGTVGGGAAFLVFGRCG